MRWAGTLRVGLRVGWLLLLCFMASACWGQGGNNITNTWSFTTTTPTGTCNQGQAWVVMPGGSLYTCVNGTPTVQGGGGSGTGCIGTSPCTFANAISAPGVTSTGATTFPTPFTLGAVSVTSTGTQLNYLANATGVSGSGGVVLGAVGGASNCGTANQVLYAASAGVATCSANLTFDGTTLSVASSSASATQGFTYTNANTAGSAYQSLADGAHSLLFQVYGSTASGTTYGIANNVTTKLQSAGAGIILDGGNGSGFLALVTNSIPQFYQSQSSTGIGPSNISLGTLTASFLDRTATTGATAVYIGSDNNGHISATTTRVNLLKGASDAATTNTFITDASFSFSVVGAGQTYKAGSNARTGTGTLSGGTLAVANTSVTANSQIFVQDTSSGSLANVGSLVVSSQTAGTGFTVTSTNVLDASTFRYWIFETN